MAGGKKQRTCNKFFFKLNKTAAETHQMLKEAFGEQALSQARTFELLVNGWITCTHYGWGKQMCVVSCSTHDFKISWVCLLPHTELQEAFIAGDTSKAQSICLWRLYTLKTIIRESIKCDILSVSISVAWYQKYVHIKACLATGCIYTEPGGRTRMLYTCTWQGQLRWPGISRKKHWSMSPIPLNIYLQTTEVHRNQNAPCNYRYTRNSGKQEVTLELS